MSVLDYKVVIEGFDGVGKSSLAKDLYDYGVGRGIHYSAGPPADESDAANWCLKQFDALHNGRQILDRVTCVSEVCYRLDINPMVANWLRVFRRPMLLNVNLVFCRSDNPKHIANSETDSKDYLSWLESNQKAILDNYEREIAAIRATGEVNVIYFDFAYDNFRDVIQQLRSFD